MRIINSSDFLFNLNDYKSLCQINISLCYIATSLCYIATFSCNIATSLSPRNRCHFIIATLTNYDSYDKLLLFTDGVTDCLSYEKIKSIANTFKGEEMLKKIIYEAVNVEQEKPKNITLPEDFRVYPTPGKDNATGAILIKR